MGLHPFDAMVPGFTNAGQRQRTMAPANNGIADIQHHCVQHLSHNPSSSYVSWIATLHPENAQVTINTRFLTPDNPWLTVYEEAKEDLQKGKGTIPGVLLSAPAYAYPRRRR